MILQKILENSHFFTTLFIEKRLIFVKTDKKEAKNVPLMTTSVTLVTTMTIFVVACDKFPDLVTKMLRKHGFPT
jgi:hypothetical protein